MAAKGNVNGATPSEFSYGRGFRPSQQIVPQPDAENDPLALKRAQMQVDSTDPGAPLDFDGTYQGYDKFGQEIPNMRERGYTPIVRETGRGELDDAIPNNNPRLYREATGEDPNYAWRNAERSDPVRVGWEEGNFDPEVVASTAQHKLATNKELSDATQIRSKGQRLGIERTPDPNAAHKHIKHKGYDDPRVTQMPWL